MRLIDADRFEDQMNEELLPELIKEYGKEEALKGLHFSFRDCICNIQSQPPVDAVEVIRCKDCRWDSECRRLDDDNGFCSEAERREIDRAEDIPMEYWENGGI